MAFNRQSTEIHRVPQAWHSVFFCTLTGCQQQDTRYFFRRLAMYTTHHRQIHRHRCHGSPLAQRLNLSIAPTSTKGLHAALMVNF